MQNIDINAFLPAHLKNFDKYRSQPRSVGPKPSEYIVTIDDVECTETDYSLSGGGLLVIPEGATHIRPSGCLSYADDGLEFVKVTKTKNEKYQAQLDVYEYQQKKYQEELAVYNKNLEEYEAIVNNRRKEQTILEAQESLNKEYTSYQYLSKISNRTDKQEKTYLKLRKKFADVACNIEELVALRKSGLAKLTNDERMALGH